jgi:hypothetical protein
MNMTLWEKLCKNAKDTIDGLKAPFVKNSIERKFSSAEDDANCQIIDLNKTIFSELEKVGDMDINKIIKCKSDIRKLNDAINDLKELKATLFEHQLEE